MTQNGAPTRAEVAAVVARGGSRGRTIAIALAVLAMALGGSAWVWSQTRPDAPAKAAPNYVTAPVTSAPIVVRVTATGTVQPTNKVDISSELSGVVRDVRVDFNSRVKAGDVLATLDPVKLTAAAESARARLAAAQAELRDSQVSLEEKQGTWERKRKLAETSVGSAQDRDTAKAAYERAVVAIETAKANILSAQAQLRLDETNLSRTQIVSPIDGVVLMRKVDPGQTVASSLQAPVLFTVAEDLTRMEAQVDIDEADVGRVKDGQSATFTVDAYPNRRFDARIRMVRFGSEVVQGVVTYKAVLTTKNEDLALRPGMTATADIVVERLANALTVPNQALRFTPPADQQARGAQDNRSFLERLLPGRPSFRPPSAGGGQGAGRRVHVLRDGEAIATPVRVGASDERRTQILEGELKEGDAVILEIGRRRR